MQMQDERPGDNNVRGGGEMYLTISAAVLPTCQGKNKHFHFRKKHVRHRGAG